MFRDALNEIRLHPSRFVATLLAIAISVGFIVAISTAVATESRAMGLSNALSYSKADVVVEGYFDQPGLLGEINQVDGVASATSGASTLAMLHAERASVFIDLNQLLPEAYRWAEISEGRWPQTAQEIALSSDGMAELGVAVGDVVVLDSSDGIELTVVGQTADARSLYSTTAYATPGLFAEYYQRPLVELEGQPATIEVTPYVLQLDGKVPMADVISAIDALLPADIEDATVLSAADARQKSLNDMTGDIDIFKYLLYSFAGIALLVGMIIISNTFTILVTQRRRQIGLLRAVGASTGQVRGRLIIEAVMLGVVGSLLGAALGIGVAVIAATVTGSLFWGLAVNPVELAVALGVGVFATVLAVLSPSLAATRVKPIEALQTVPSVSEARRAGWVRAVICGLFLLLGIGLIVLSRLTPSLALVWALLAGAAISVGVLGAAPLFVAPVLRGLGRLFGWTGLPTRLAAQNAARNPRRAAATTVALMLAVGLVVTLQVGVSTVRSTGLAAIDEMYPQDLTASGPNELSSEFIDDVRSASGAAQVVQIQSKEVELGLWEPIVTRNINAARAELGLPDRLDAPDGHLLVSEFLAGELGDSVTVPGADGGEITLTVKESSAMPIIMAAVSDATFQEIDGQSAVKEIWITLVDRTSATDLNSVMTALEAGPSDLVIEGAAVIAGILEQALDVIMIVLTALLGVAVVIALVGVSNTLGLSVIERQRESALLRALGMQKSGLRLMLLAEAMLLALAGTATGVLAGAFFGWLGVSSTLLMMSGQLDLPARFSVDVPVTVGLVLVCIAAAALASVLPGRRAANATPVEALAAE